MSTLTSTMNTSKASPSPFGALEAILDPRVLASFHDFLPIHPETDAPVPPPLPVSAEASPSEPKQPARHPGGRPNNCTPETLELICQGIAKGLSDTAAAALVGVPAATLSRWKHDHDGVVETFTAARERYRALLLDRLHNAKTRDGRDDWRATAWLLERSFPEDYGRKRLSQPSPRHEFHQHPSAPWNDSPDPEPERPRDRWTPFIAERRRQEAERAAREADLAGKEQTHGTPSSETSETQPVANSGTYNAPEATTSETSGIGPRVPNSAPKNPPPNTSETTETPLSEAEEPAISGLSRRERRRRAHLQRKALAAQQRTASKTAPLAAAA